MERKTLRELVAKKQIFAPIVWDVMSARCAQIAGFEATLLSGGVVAGNCATPDIGLITADDLVRVTKNVCSASPLPCCVDADDGYGETPLHAYRTTKRLAEAGAMALTLDDTTGVRGYNRWGMQLRTGTPFGEIPHPTVSRDVFLAKTRADEAIERCVRAEELGAEMTLIIGLMTLDQAKEVAKYVKGWKMWPDVMAPGGVPDVAFEDIEKLGFNYITAHCITKGAQYGMISYGEQVLKDKSTVYCDTHDMGLSEAERADIFHLESDDEWFAREATYWRRLKHPYLGKIEE
jgi:2-methylisocitrate lyase-like PEP mutase family enzyme